MDLKKINKDLDTFVRLSLISSGYDNEGIKEYFEEIEVAKKNKRIENENLNVYLIEFLMQNLDDYIYLSEEAEADKIANFMFFIIALIKQLESYAVVDNDIIEKIKNSFY